MAAAVPTKVFVGNLSFKTRDADLAHAFEAVGKVTSANIITRGPRSLGYGFVELSSEDEAKKAIAQLNKTDLDGRQINVEIARPREQTSQDAAGPNSPAAAGRPRPRPRRRPRQPHSGDASPAAGAVSAAPAAAAAGGATAPASKPRRARKPRSSSPSAVRGAAGSPPAASPASGDVAAADARRPARRGRRRFGRYQRFRRQHTDEPRIPSTTTLFVANLHYQIDNEGLAGIFKEFNPVKAYVVQTNSGRSRGFGFVEFGGEADQQNALKGVDKKVVSERPLSVKVSQVRQTPPAAAASEAPKN